MLYDVLAILDEWVGSGVMPSLTSRAILYRLLPLGWSKDDAETLGVVLTRGRRSGRIPFDWIADGRSENHFPTVWESAAAFTAQMRKHAAAFRDENIERDVTALAADRLVQHSTVDRERAVEIVRACSSFEVAAITRAQVAEHAIPTEPAKPRGNQRLPVGWEVGDPTAQAEALPPNAILLAIRTAVEAHLDPAVLAQTKRDELEARAELLDALGEP
jgi:hypothetical protein